MKEAKDLVSFLLKNYSRKKMRIYPWVFKRSCWIIGMILCAYLVVNFSLIVFNKEDREIFAIKDNIEMARMNGQPLYEYYATLAYCYEKHSEIDSAFVYYNKVPIALWSRLDSSLINKGVHFFIEHDLDLADDILSNLPSNPNCEYLSGIVYAKKGKPNTAKEKFEDATKAGNNNASLHLAIDYLIGMNSVKQDTVKGIQLLLEIMDGNADAKFILGQSYRIGRFVDKDTITGLKLIKESADMDNEFAMFVYGKYLIRNDEKIEGKRLLENSALAGCRQAAFELGKWSEDGNADLGISKNIEDALSYYERAGNYAEAQYRMSRIYLALGGETNLQKSLKLHEIACLNGFDDVTIYADGAIYQHHECYEPTNEKDLDSVPDNTHSLILQFMGLYPSTDSIYHNITLKYLDNVVEDGCLANALGIAAYKYDKDNKKAFEYFRLADTIKDYYSSSSYNLALCYKYGIGCERNIDKAVFYAEKYRSWVKLASELNIIMYMNMFARIYDDDKIYFKDHDTYLLWMNKAANSTPKSQSDYRWVIASNMFIFLDDVSKQMDSRIIVILKLYDEMNTLFEQGRFIRNTNPEYLGQNDELIEIQNLLNSLLPLLKYTSTLFKKMTILSNKGNCYANYILACFFEKGINTPPDRFKAIDLYTKAAEQGIIDAQIYLAKHYLMNIDSLNKYKKLALDNKQIPGERSNKEWLDQNKPTILLPSR